MAEAISESIRKSSNRIGPPIMAGERLTSAVQTLDRLRKEACGAIKQFTQTSDIERVGGRRAFIASAIAVIPAALAVPDFAVSHRLLDDDAELIALVDRLFELDALAAKAGEEYSRCLAVYGTMCKERPPTLLWRETDPVHRSDEKHIDEKGRTFFWCDEDSIDDLRDRISFTRWEFIGNDEERAKLSIPNWRDGQSLPVVGYGHLFVAVDDPDKRQRAQHLIEALDQDRASLDDAYRRSGLKVAEDAQDAIYDQVVAVRNRILDLQPVTLEGNQALVKSLKSRA